MAQRCPLEASCGITAERRHSTAEPPPEGSTLRWFTERLNLRSEIIDVFVVTVVKVGNGFPITSPETLIMGQGTDDYILVMLWIPEGL